MSEAGNAWAGFYQGAELSWCRPGEETPEKMLRFAKTEWIRKIASLLPERAPAETRILEAGCGTGYYALVLGLLGFCVDAFDYNEGAVRIAREMQARLAAAGYRPAVTFSTGNLLSIGGDADRYDLVFNQAVLEYFRDPAERSRAISEMVRVARPGGAVAAILQHTGHPFRGWWRALGWRGYENQPPVFSVTPPELGSEWRQAGLEAVKLDGIYPWKAFTFGPDWKKYPALLRESVYLTGRVLDRIPLPRACRAALGPQLLVSGKKRGGAA